MDENKSKYFCSTLHTGINAPEEGGWRETTIQLNVKAGELGQKIEDKCVELDEKGYEIISIMPIISGAGKLLLDNDSGAGAGISYTSSIIITAKLRES